MIRIAVVDDEREQIDHLIEIISCFFSQKHIKYMIDDFESGENLLKSKTVFDIIFLDIQMSGIDGIETAQKLRINNKRTALFYVTSYSDYVLKSMATPHNCQSQKNVI